MNITTFTSAEAFLQSAYNIFLQSLSPTETNFIGLSGGSTPGPLYEKIGKESKKLPQNLEFFLLDERNVSLESSDSNFQLVQNTLFKNPETKELTNLHFFQTSLPREEVNAVYQQELEVLTKKPLNLAILGIGPDGHFASIFPHSPALRETTRLSMSTETTEFAVKERFTVHPSLIMNAKKLLVLLKGKEKQPIIEELENPQKSLDQFPAHLLGKHQNLTILYLK